MAYNGLTPIVYHLQQGLRNIDLRSWTQDFNLQNIINDLDLKTVGSLALVIVAVIFVLDFLTKSFGFSGKGLAVSAADAWKANRDQNRFNVYGRNSHSFESVTEVLDALAEAVKKWEEPQGDVRYRPY